ncbi:MAG: hypothetical protein ACI9EK_002254, partial [Psychroserpens sp.]
NVAVSERFNNSSHSCRKATVFVKFNSLVHSL